MAQRHNIDMFEIFYENLEKQIAEFFEKIERPVSRNGEILPSLDIYETDEMICIEMELPGIKNPDIDISVIGKGLQIEAIKRNEETGKPVLNYICMERGFGKVKRLIEINSPCDTNRIKATLKDGLLTITIPKIEDRRGRAKKLSVEELNKEEDL
ncbi:MAG TPA: Hsp20/alpha crystallin family protein [bacterium]